MTSATYAPPGTLATDTNGFVSGGFTGITTANTYNSRLQPILMSAASPTASILSLCYDFHSKTAINLPPCSFSASTIGDNGSVFQIVNNRDGNRTQNFLYDSLNRIQQAYTNGSVWGETFGPTTTNPGVPPSSPGIDAWGNLMNRSGVTGKTLYESLNCAPNTNNQANTCLGYDAAGNVTSNSSATYTYNQEDQMTKFVTTTTDIYVYDGDGQRVKKNIGAVTLYWYGATGNVLDETSSNGTLVSEYIYFNGKRVARRDADNSVHYYFSDHLGSASVVTNATGTMTNCPAANSPMNYTTIPTGEEESDFYPFGGEMQFCDRAFQHYKFTGKERDSESGLDNFGARYFTSNLGRFMTPDWAARPTAVPYAVFGDPQSLNLYTYVRNDPVSRADADGHQIRGSIWGAIGQAEICGGPNGEGLLINCIFAAAANLSNAEDTAAQESAAQQNTQQAGAQNTTSLSPQGLAFIERHEGYSDKVYNDVAGNPTIGYGHLIREGEDFSKGITKEKAGELLAQDTKSAVDSVNSKVTGKLSQAKFDAVVDFTYNLGGKALGKSTLLKNINAGKDVTKENFTDWNHAGGKVVNGLTIRRTDEFNLFTKGDYGGP